MKITTDGEVDSRPVLKPGDWTLRGKNPTTPVMEENVHIATEERLKSDGTWTSERVSPSDGHSETLEMFNKAVEAALKNPQIVKTIEDRAEGAKQAYEYFLGPQQYWRFKYKDRIYSLCSATNTPIDLQAVLDKIAAGTMPSEPEPQCEFSAPKDERWAYGRNAYWGS